MNNLKIIFEDNNLMVLDKPSGWIVNTATTTKDQPVVQDWLYKRFDYPIAKNNIFRSGIVHRIDKETSGLLVVAKNQKAFEELQRQFKERIVKKTYIALVHGKLLYVKGTINVPVGRLPWRRERFGIISGGRDSKTDYELIHYYSKDDNLFSLIKCYPKTGRTHQIRIHMKHLGFPIVGDLFYAGRKTSRDDRIWCKRLFLHSSEITFLDPVNKSLIKVESELPNDLKEVLKILKSE